MFFFSESVCDNGDSTAFMTARLTPVLDPPVTETPYSVLL